MKIGIHDTKGSFSDRWSLFCEAHMIDYKLVDCYGSDIIQQLSDCDALMWHFSQNSPKAILFAKQLIYSVEAVGKKVFPNFHTVWHFDDKVGQKYLLEAINAPLATTWVFYDKRNALAWVKQADFPKVFKLRGGAGSQNVSLVSSKNKAIKLVSKAFSRGFPAFDPWGSIKDEWHRFRMGKANMLDLVEAMVRLILPPPYALIKGREKGYIYFQEYIPNNSSDIRIIVIGNKAFAIKRMVRENDFRASGSGMIFYEKEHFNDEIIRLSFHLAEKLKTQCAAFDFVYSSEKTFVLEVSYGFMKEGYDPCTGYWDKDLEWHDGKFDPCGWMVEDIVNSIGLQE
jgi:glutathione synthase/RimK-type ligase-like ATP-grasp enzyme